MDTNFVRACTDILQALACSRFSGGSCIGESLINESDGEFRGIFVYIFVSLG